MTELGNNQVEITLRYTGSEPEKVLHLARVALTFKGFSFDQDMRKPVPYEKKDEEYTATLIGTNQFISEQPEKLKEEKEISIMNNAPLALSPEGQKLEQGGV